MTTGQELLLYKCKCGFTSSDKKKFDGHLLHGGKKDGKGVHKSEGRVNGSTGEIVMPPFDQRNKDQKAASTYALKKKDSEPGSSIRQTELVTAATQIKFVPRVLVCSLKPSILAGWAADQEIWGWPSDMPFEDVIEQWCVHFHRDRGIELTAYVVKNPQEHEAIRVQNQSAIALAEKDELKQEGNHDN
jgi:hypothetical protein